MPEAHELANRECKEVLKKVMAHKMAHPFMVPVDPVALGIPGYTHVIKTPMDLGTIRSNLQRAAYLNGGAFVADVRLVFSNAMTFNPPGTDVHIMASTLLEEFERLLKPYVRHVSAAKAAAATALAQPEVEVIPELTSRQMSQLLGAVKRTDEGGWYFSEPVDPERLGIPDYFAKILHPMDLGKAKGRAADGRHRHLQRAAAGGGRRAPPSSRAPHHPPQTLRAPAPAPAAAPRGCSPRTPLRVWSGTIEKRLEKGMYEDTASFVADVRLVWANAKSYNPPGTSVHDCALKLEDMFERDLRRASSGVRAPPHKAALRTGPRRGSCAASHRRGLLPRAVRGAAAPARRRPLSLRAALAPPTVALACARSRARASSPAASRPRGRHPRPSRRGS